MTGAKLLAAGIGALAATPPPGLSAAWAPAVAIDLSPTGLAATAAVLAIGAIQWLGSRQIAAAEGKVTALEIAVADLTTRLTRLEERHAALLARFDDA